MQKRIAKMKYADLVRKSKLRGLRKEKGYEIHHIKPKSFGADDRHKNLVKLTYVEHYQAHLLLAHFHTGWRKDKMMVALWNCFCMRKEFVDFDVYEKMREEMIDAISKTTKRAMRSMSTEMKNEMKKNQKAGLQLAWNKRSPTDDWYKERSKLISNTIKKKWESGEFCHKVRHTAEHYCHFCAKLIKGPSNISQHERRCEQNPIPGTIHADTEFYFRKNCQYCNKLIAGGSYHINRHEKTCRSKND